MQRYYPSLNEDKILAMTPQKTKYYMQAMERIKARERLELMDCLQYPNSDQKEKKRKHKALYRQAYPDNFKERVIKTTDLELF